MTLTRRAFVGGAMLLPFAAGCAKKQAEAPLAHLYGKDWVHGAYALYAGSYLKIQTDAEQKSFDAYKVLAQKGVTALDGLQQREVPFFLKLSADGQRYEIHRDVPERLTFTADMSQEQRDEATHAWQVAREHIHTDYDEIRRLDWAMTELLHGIGRVRTAIDEADAELYRLCRRISEVKEGKQLDYALPYQVTREDYERILYLLLDRLDRDRARLIPLEASIVAVGLSSRATDSGSASMALNVKKVLLAVASDADAADKPPPATYPASTDELDSQLKRGLELHAKVTASPEYQAWLRAEREKETEAVGAFLALLDSATGLPTSVLFKQVMKIWNGEGDYLEYLSLAAELVPGGSSLKSVLEEGLSTTKKARQLYGKVLAVKDKALEIRDKARELQHDAEQAQALASAVAGGGAEGAFEAIEGAGLVNVATREARRGVQKQLVLIQTPEEVPHIQEAMDSSWLMKNPMPALPTAPANPG